MTADMEEVEAGARSRPGPQVLFVQLADPAAYPPIMNAAALLADLGARATLLSCPIRDSGLVAAPHPGVHVRAVAVRLSHVVRKSDYLRYSLAAALAAVRHRPRIVYASDPFSAGPALLAAGLSGATLVYHEHDTPGPGALKSWFARLRRALARRADLVVFPNAERARIVREELGLDPARIRIVWNTPRREELPVLAPPPDEPLRLYYHGSITPERAPDALARAVAAFAGRVRLDIAGYEAPGAEGHVRRLVELGGTSEGESLVRYLGEIPTRRDLLDAAARAHVGLALMPLAADDLNLRHMLGASNKAFDYMAAGLAVLVSDLQDWREMFVGPGYGLACDPADEKSIGAALQWWLDRPAERRAMAAAGRRRIEADWNYDAAFAPVAGALIP